MCTSEAQMKKYRVLRLTLSAKPFEATRLGEKHVELRRDSAWIRSRLIVRHSGLVREYDYISYRHGYATDSPYTVCAWGGTVWCEEEINLGPYSNGLVLKTSGGMWAICNLFT